MHYVPTESDNAVYATELRKPICALILSRESNETNETVPTIKGQEQRYYNNYSIASCCSVVARHQLAKSKLISFLHTYSEWENGRGT